MVAIKKAIYHTEISLQLRKGKTPWVKGIEILAFLLHSVKQRHSLASRSNQCKPSLNSDLPHTINYNRVVARAYLNIRVKIIHDWFECINQMFWHVMSSTNQWGNLGAKKKIPFLSLAFFQITMTFLYISHPTFSRWTFEVLSWKHKENSKRNISLCFLSGILAAKICVTFIFLRLNLKLGVWGEGDAIQFTKASSSSKYIGCSELV